VAFRKFCPSGRRDGDPRAEVRKPVVLYEPLLNAISSGAIDGFEQRGEYKKRLRNDNQKTLSESRKLQTEN
jgi:hypothetical protein